MSTQTAQRQAEAAQALWRLVADDLMDRRQDNIVRNASDIVRAYFRPYNENLTGPEPKLERKQLTNLESIAGETHSIALIADFVRYQMGRDTKDREVDRTWRARLNLTGQQVRFGDAILKQLEEELREEAGSIVRAAQKEDLKPANESDEKVFIWWLLARRFVSYLEHAFVCEETEYKERRKQARKKER